MNRFNNEDYDGIVLMIDSGFIATNPELKEALNTFKKALENCKFSTMMPSYIKNLEELENYQEKREFLRDQEKRRREEKEKREEDLRKRLEHEVLPIEEDYYTSLGNDYYLTLGDKDYKNVYTKKSGLKAEVERAFYEYIANCSLDEFIVFCRENNFHLEGDILTPLFNHKKTKIYINTYGYLAIKLPIIRVHFYHVGKRKNDNVYYFSPMLQWCKKENEWYVQGSYSAKLTPITEEINGRTCARSYLKDYEMKQGMFVKK